VHLLSKMAIAGILSSALVFSAQAQETNFSYTQLSAAYIYTDFDDDIIVFTGPSSGEVYSDIGGAALSGSYQFNNNVIIGVSGSYQENSGSRTEISARQSLFTVGYAFPAAQSVDIVLSGGLAYAEAEACVSGFGCSSVDDNGIYVAGGMRAWASSWLELNAAVSHVNYDDFESETALNIGAAGWFDDSSSIFLNLSFGDDANSTALGYRYAF